MQRFFSYIAFFMLVLAASAAYAQQTLPPGTSIDNLAQGRHTASSQGDTVFVNSNMVSALIQAAENIQLVPNNRARIRTGQSQTFTHRLINTGNISSTVTITAANITGDDYNLNDITLSTGEQQNAKSNNASAAPSDSLTVTLSPGQEFEFQVSMRVPNEAQSGQLGNVLIQARTEEGDIVLQNNDIIEVLEGPVVEVEKEQTTETATQGGRIGYRISGTNTGDQTARSLTISVDGNTQRKVLLRDRIPVNTTFTSVEDAGGGTPLFHILGSPERTYQSNLPNDLSSIDEFAVATDSLAPGQQLEARFAVHINDNAAGEITNIARMEFRDPVDDEEQVSEAQTNTVRAPLPEHDATLNYFTDDSYNRISPAARLGNLLRLQADAAGCNVNFASPDTAAIFLTSQKTEDQEKFRAIETGNNTGFFQVQPNVPTRSADEFEVAKNNGIFETLPNDVIIASIPECNNQNVDLTARIFVSPSGVVFNSQTNEPVPGAIVELVDTETGNPAEVLNEEGTEPVENPQTTEEDGEFRFPIVAPGTYRIEVTTPASYIFASSVPIEELAESRNLSPQSSYGEPFSIIDNPAPAAFDIPLDPEPVGDLFIEKISLTNSAAIGDFITYQITVANNAAVPVAPVRVEDTLPFGFRYEEGTARLNGVSINDPKGGKGPSISFNIAEIDANSTVDLTYRVLLGAGTRNGEATNTAVALSEGTLNRTSNEARSTIDVRGGVFTDEGYIIGKVFADCNENDVQDAGEPGVPGVRLYLENGNFVITDSEGQYTFYGITPNKHIVKVDNYSLPEDSRLGELDNRHAGDLSSRFVDLKRGQMHRADFSICGCNPTVHNEIKARRDQYREVATDELGTSIERDIEVEDNNRRGSVRREKASGTIGGAKIPGIKKSGGQGDAAQKKKTSPGFETAVDTNASTEITLEEAMIHEEAELGFIGLVNNDTLQTSQTTIWTKGKLGTSLKLSVNGEKIDESRISKKSSLSELNLQAQEYIGVDLKPGPNTITVTETDPFGNERGSKEITVFAPGQVDEIKLTVPVNDVPANGSSAAAVRVQLLDEVGVAVETRIPITLDASIGTWLVKDLDLSAPGTQTYIKGGATDFELQSTIEPQDANVRVSIGVMQAETIVHFLPDLRPLIAAGIIEGTIRLNDGASIVPARSADGFERELKSLSYSNGNTTTDARAAFFLKGKIKGNLLLTAGFDSEKDDDRLFRDIQPDEFYPVYGESSIKGYDAQSTGRLYVRVDHKRTYALYGDFITQERHPAKSLGEYNRTQTGLKFHYENNRVRLNAFGSQATSLQRIDEFRGQGISGPYELQFDNILINSEQVEIVTRDRNQPSVVISRERLTRFRDYVVEPFTGNIIFKSAVPSVDEELNPIFIRVTYEVEDGAEDYLVGGADGQIKVTDSFEVGGSFVEDRAPDNNYRLASVNTTLRLGENTVLIGEAAQSTTEEEGSGTGGRVELQHRGNAVDARLYAGQTDEDFVNQASTLGQGRTEAGARGKVKLTSSTNLAGEFIYTSNDTLNNNTTGGLLNIEQRITEDIRLEAGLRYAKQNQSQTGTTEQEDITNKNLRGKLTVGVPKVKGASVFGEYEQDINESERKLIALGGDYKVKSLGRIYARHEFISSAVGQFNLNGTERRQNTVVGLDAEYMQNGQVYSEYRVDNAFDGRNAQAAIGLRNRFEIYEGFGINAGFERVFSLSGDPLNEGTALSTAIDYTANPLWKGTARAEARFSRNGNRYLNTLGYGRKLNTNWTFLGKNIFSLQTSTNAGTTNRIQQRLRVGAAYRQTEQNRWDALGRYELKYEENGQFGGDYNRLVHIFSTNVNYHPGADWTHSGRFAAKKVGESSADFDSESLTMLLSARSIYDITRKLDGGLNASFMTDAGFGSKDYGVGAELGYIIQRNLRLAVGFNVSGFEDRDLTASNYTRKGVYLGFSYKFDERLFKGLIPDEDKKSEVYATCDVCEKEGHVQSIEKPVKALRLPEPEIEFEGLKPIIFEAPDLRYSMSDSLIKLPENVHFAAKKYEISDDSKPMLDMVADFLRDQQFFDLRIHGHTDSRDSFMNNLHLSIRRAYAVREYLVSKGVNGDLISDKGFSERAPVVLFEKDAIDRALNRRAELGLDISARFIKQINDLQIEKRISKNIEDWDYIFNTQTNAVPDRIHLKNDFFAGLTAINKYMLKRIILAMHYYPEEKVRFNVTEKRQEKIIASFMQQAGADMDRINFKLIWDASNRLDQESLFALHNHSKKERDRQRGYGKIEIEYGNETNLAATKQEDDRSLANIPAVKPMLAKMIDLLKLQQDQLLIKNEGKQ